MPMSVSTSSRRSLALTDSSEIRLDYEQELWMDLLMPDESQTRILNTHGIGYLPHVDQIVVMKDGKVSEIGTYAELIENQGAFAEFITNFADESNGWCEAVCVINSCCINRKPATVQRRFILFQDSRSKRKRCSSGGGCDNCQESDDSEAYKSDHEIR